MSFSDWTEYKLGSVSAKIGSGATPRGGKETYLDSGDYALIRSQNVLDFSFSYNGLAYINVEQATKLNNVALEKDDVLLNITGDSVARVCQIPNNLLPARVNQHVAIIRPKKNILNNTFLKYYLLNPLTKSYLLNLSSVGATRNAITKSMIEDLVVVLPKLEVQERIAFILSSLDDKIELNNQTNQTLETIAQTLFKEMCVSNDCDLHEGWRMGKFSEVANQVKSSVNPTLAPEKLFKHYSLPAFDAGEVPADDLGSSILSNKTIVKRYSVLFSKLNPRIPRIWSIGDIDENTSICSTEFIGFVAHKPYSYSFINYFLKQQEVISKLTGHATGTSSSHQRVNPSDMLDLNLSIPPEQTLVKFDKIVKPLLERRFQNILENQTLKTVRDSLLPKLMKGEIAVNNINFVQ